MQTSKTPLLFILFLSLLLAACAGVAPPVSEEATATDGSPQAEGSPSVLEIAMAPIEEVSGPTATPPVLPTPTLVPSDTDLGPSDVDYVALGYQAYYAGVLDGALDAFNAAVRAHPEEPEAYFGRAEVLFELGEFHQALLDYSQAITLRPDYAAAYNGRGEVYFQLGNRNQAVLDFSAAIQIDPTFGPAYQNRALTQKELGFPAAAVADLQVYQALAPESEDSETIQELIEDLEILALPFEVDRDGRVYADDFSDFTTGWFGNGDIEGLAYYNSGGYRLNIPLAGKAIWGINNYLIADLRIEVDVQMVGGSENNLYGILCRYQDVENFYAFLISSDGYYGLGRRVNGGPLEPTAAGQLQYTDVIKRGDAKNHITAECFGSNLRLWVNGVLLVDVQDTSVIAGRVGLIAASFEVAGTDVLFDNFEIYETEKQR